MTQLFGPAGPRRSLAEQLAQAQEFARGARPGAVVAAPGVAAQPGVLEDLGAVAPAPAVVPGAEFVPAGVGDDIAGAAGDDLDALARAAQAGAAGDVVADVAPNPAPARESIRNWTVQDFGNMFGNRRPVAPVAEQVVPAAGAEAPAVAEAPAGRTGGFMDQLRDSLALGRQPAARGAAAGDEAADIAVAAAPVEAAPPERLGDRLVNQFLARRAGAAEAGADVAAAGGGDLLAQLRNGVAGLGAARPAGEAAPVVAEVLEAGARAGSLAEQAIQAFRVVNPRG